METKIVEVLTCILFWTLFKYTNSIVYSIIGTCLCFVLIVLDFIPKVSQKHFVFNFITIAEAIVLTSMIFCGKILIDK